MEFEVGAVIVMTGSPTTAVSAVKPLTVGAIGNAFKVN